MVVPYAASSSKESQRYELSPYVVQIYLVHAERQSSAWVHCSIQYVHNRRPSLLSWHAGINYGRNIGMLTPRDADGADRVYHHDGVVAHLCNSLYLRTSKINRSSLVSRGNLPNSRPCTIDPGHSDPPCCPQQRRRRQVRRSCCSDLTLR
jgi:hypothetical protein